MKLSRIHGRGEEVLILEIKISPAPSLCSEASPGAGPQAKKVASGCPVYNPSRIYGVWVWDQARSWGGWLLAQFVGAIPASVLGRKGILEMVASSSSLGTQASRRRVECGSEVRPRL